MNSGPSWFSGSKAPSHWGREEPPMPSLEKVGAETEARCGTFNEVAEVTERCEDFARDIASNVWPDDRLTALSFDDKLYLANATDIRNAAVNFTPPRPRCMSKVGWFCVLGKDLRRLCRADASGTFRSSPSLAGETPEDFYCNDEIVNGLATLLNLRSFLSSGGDGKKSHVHSSFFVQTLFDVEHNPLGYDPEEEETYSYDAVRRWMKNKNLWEMNLLIFPVHIPRSQHWALLYIDLNKNVIRYECSLNMADELNCTEGIKRWLLEEIKCQLETRNGGQALRSWSTKRWKILINRGNRSAFQRDATSCGIFAMFTAERILAGRSPDFHTVADVHNLRLRAALYLSLGFIPGLLVT